MNPTRKARRQQQRGLTFLEGLAGLTVLAVTLGTVAPGFQQMRERRQLEGSAAQLATDLRLARSLAVSQGSPVRLTLHTDTAGSCYVVHTGPASECSCSGSGTASCSAGAQLIKAEHFEAAASVRLSASARSMLFDPDRGTVTPTSTLRVESRSGAAIHQIVNIMGRVRACSPERAVAGLPAC